MPQPLMTSQLKTATHRPALQSHPDHRTTLNHKSFFQATTGWDGMDCSSRKLKTVHQMFLGVTSWDNVGMIFSSWDNQFAKSIEQLAQWGAKQHLRHPLRALPLRTQLDNGERGKAVRPGSDRVRGSAPAEGCFTSNLCLRPIALCLVTCQQSPGYIPSGWSPGNHHETVPKLNEISKVPRSPVYPVWGKAERERSRAVGTVLLALLKVQSIPEVPFAQDSWSVGSLISAQRSLEQGCPLEKPSS